MKLEYFESVILTEKIHRLFLEALKMELKHLDIRDISNIQALVIYQIGRNKMTVGELIQRGYYMGSNVSYNLKKMIQNRYIDQKKSDFDKRSSIICLTEKGLNLYNKLDKFINKHAECLPKEGLNENAVIASSQNLKKLEHFLSRAISEPAYFQ